MQNNDAAPAATTTGLPAWFIAALALIGALVLHVAILEPAVVVTVVHTVSAPMRFIATTLTDFAASLIR